MKRLLVGLSVLSPLPLFAAAADAATITTTATTAFEAVSTLVVAVAGFYIVLKIVRGIRGR